MFSICACRGEDDDVPMGAWGGSPALSGLGPPGLWVIEKSWRDHNEDDKKKMPRRFVYADVTTSGGHYCNLTVDQGWALL